ncbi:hypothetical protein C5S36_15085 [Candidatus Methanophagaceae archaeon]|nr:hypothetical protein C5S36_15085 [Methanophagales archaeon]
MNRIADENGIDRRKKLCNRELMTTQYSTDSASAE